MKPKIVTSYRPHGKWGDFLAAIIPGLWCLNILTNSNFILRLLEWQNESSLFVIRIRARQWYWIYKFEIRNLIDIFSTPKNLGHNRWVFTNFGDLYTSDNYIHLLQLRVKSKVLKNHWSIIFSGILKNTYNNTLNLTELNSKLDLLNDKLVLPKFIKKNIIWKNQYFLGLKTYAKAWNLYNFNICPILIYPKNNYTTSILLYDDIINNKLFIKNFNQKLLLNSPHYQLQLNQPVVNNYVNFDSSRLIKRSQGYILPIRILKFPILTNCIIDDLFKIKFGTGNAELQPKLFNDIFFYTIKQNKYKRRTSIPIYYKTTKNLVDAQTPVIKYSGKPVLLNNSIFMDYLENADNTYNLLKKNKQRSEKISITLAKRILRTKRTLILPAHTNITLITNSFDVVHSWYIPGLGLKLDCVPGRSTHHTLYIDNVGFYYGQCAEICGRYHHHMPIRICALPFEHFLLWWNVFGLPRIMFINNQHRFHTTYPLRKFLW